MLTYVSITIAGKLVCGFRRLIESMLSDDKIKSSKVVLVSYPPQVPYRDGLAKLHARGHSVILPYHIRIPDRNENFVFVFLYARAKAMSILPWPT